MRQAENTGILKAAIKVLEKDKAFSGMPELYTTISEQEPVPKFIIVSAISIWFDNRINSFLMDSKFPPHQRYLRNWLTQLSIEEFKLAKIKEVIFERAERKFIIIFDNSEASLLLVSKLREQFLNQIQAIYLRQVIEKNIPAGASTFFTAYDIVLAEFAANRMSSDEVEIIANAILREEDVSMIFPAYAICPKSYNPCKKRPISIQERCEKV